MAVRRRQDRVWERLPSPQRRDRRWNWPLGPDDVLGFVAQAQAVIRRNQEPRFLSLPPTFVDYIVPRAGQKYLYLLSYELPLARDRVLSPRERDEEYAKAAAGTPLEFRGAQAYGVVNLLNGNVLMSGGWGTAAPVPRGNLLEPALDPTRGAIAAGPHGIRYLDDLLADPQGREIVGRLRARFGDDVTR